MQVWRKRVVLFAMFCGALFTAIVGTMGAKFVIELFPTDQVSPDLEIPSWFVYLCIPLGSYLMCFRFLQVAWTYYWTDTLPHHDPTHVEGVEMIDAHPADPHVGGTPMSALLIFGLLFGLMLTGMPISISLGLTVLTFLFTMTQVPIESVGLKLFSGLDNFGIMAIPFFILAGTFLTRGGVAKRMINFTTSLVGHWPGGLGLAGVTACALFAAICGSSVATVAAIGSIILPAMVQQGFPKRFGAGVITTSGALGILVPPSIILVLYGVSTNTSIGTLFMAGIVPGVILALMLATVTWFIAWRNNYPRLPRATWRERLHALHDGIWGLMLVVIVLGGIYSGIFTPTEAAAVAAVYSFIITVFVYRELKLSEVPKVLLNAANLSAMLLYIITNAVLFSFLMTHEQIPQAMAAWIVEQHFSVWVFLFVVNIILAARGQRDGPIVDPADHGADPVSVGRQSGRQSDPPRHSDGGQYGGRPVPSSGRAQSLCRQRYRKDGN